MKKSDDHERRGGRTYAPVRPTRSYTNPRDVTRWTAVGRIGARAAAGKNVRDLAACVAVKGMSPALAQLAAAFAAALEDPAFAAAVAPLRPPPAADQTLDAHGAAAFLHLPVTTVRLYAREGRLPAFKVGRQWLFFRDDLEAALRSHRLAA